LNYNILQPKIKISV